MKKSLSLLNKKETKEEDYNAKYNINCSSTNCPLPSYCSEDKKACICSKERANFPLEGENGQYCMYERGNRVTSLLLEIFLNMGIGHLVAKRTTVGVIKLLCILLFPIVKCLTLCCAVSDNDDENDINDNQNKPISTPTPINPNNMNDEQGINISQQVPITNDGEENSPLIKQNKTALNGMTCCVLFGLILWCSYGLIFFIWWLVDAIKFGTNKYKDKNGISLV